MNRRAGITLIEVLVAIFVAAIGTLSLLVLFPLGALNMARAIRDDRCAQAALNASALADAGLTVPGSSLVRTFRTDPNVTAQLSASNPVYVDAIAVNVLGSSAGVGGLGGTAPTGTSIARVAPSTVTATANVDPDPPGTSPYPKNYLTFRYFRLQDDMTFDANGQADTSAGSFVNRGGRYSWAYMLRPPAKLAPGAADMAVVVYDGRNTEVAGGESFYLPATPASGTAWPIGSTSITLQYSGATSPYSTTAPPLRRGSWILDASKSDTTSRNSGAVPPDSTDVGNIHSYFYRVVDITDTGTTVVLDLETPLVTAINGASATTPGVIVVLENVAQVYERRTGWKP